MCSLIYLFIFYFSSLQELTEKAPTRQKRPGKKQVDGSCLHFRVSTLRLSFVSGFPYSDRDLRIHRRALLKMKYLGLCIPPACAECFC